MDCSNAFDSTIVKRCIIAAFANKSLTLEFHAALLVIAVEMMRCGRK